MASEIRCSFSAMNRLEDYPVTGALNAICKQIQKLDTEYEPGSRSVNLTQHKEMLNGFSFSRNQVLESVLRVSIETTLDMVTGEAHITIPQVNTDMYLYNFRKLPYYRIIANLSSTCDTIMNDEEKGYKSPYYVTCDRELGVFESEWMPAAGVQPALDILASGLLTGKFTPSTTFNPNDHRAFNRNGEAFDKGETFAGIDYLKGLNAVEEIKKLFPADSNLAANALKWILMFPEVSCIIPGASSPDQILSNQNASELPELSNDQMEGIKQIYEQYILPDVVKEKW